MPVTFETSSIEELLAELTVEEKCSLLAGRDWWNTVAIDRLGIPSIKTSDGPNGVRGRSHFRSTPSTCLPCATALGATFDTALIKEAGAFLARETAAKGGSVLLAPTINIQRDPRGGRAFESFGEDPLLSGLLAAAYVNGLQGEGIGACIKHFVCNDQEDDRMAVSIEVADRPLREIYLMPFMIAQRLAKPWAYMTSYSKLGGVHASESKWLLQTLLREEWSFDGLVMSDWYGTYSTTEAVVAGLDLEMPGTTQWRGALLKKAVASRKLSIRDVDARAGAVLQLAKRAVAARPDVVAHPTETVRKDEADIALNRRLASESIVLLKNDSAILPLDAKKIKTLTVIGSNAKQRVISGGGSAQLKPSYVVTPYEGIVAAAGDGVKVQYAIGCYSHKYLPPMDGLLKTAAGEPGYEAAFFTTHPDDEGSGPIATFVMDESRVRMNDNLPDGLSDKFYIRQTGLFTPDVSSEYMFGISVLGRARLFVNDQLVVDNYTSQRAGTNFYGRGTEEERGTIYLEGGKPAQLRIDYQTPTTPTRGELKGPVAVGSTQPGLMMAAYQFGCVQVIDEDQAIIDAAALASSSDACILMCGLNSNWESEGHDRPHLGLPGRSNELVAAVLKANPNTVVINQSGSAVAFPWVDACSTLVQAMYLGNETGNAIADVLFGRHNPSGRLPLTFPAREQDMPAYFDFTSQNGKVYYSEGLHVGYKWYDARQIVPMFPFGHGLSYTSFEVSGISVNRTTFAIDDSIVVSVTVRNTGAVEGSETCLLYVQDVACSLLRPLWELKGFAKASIKPGQSKTVDITLDRTAFCFWDDERDAWTAEPGEFKIKVVGGDRQSEAGETVTLAGETARWVGI